MAAKDKIVPHLRMPEEMRLCRLINIVSSLPGYRAVRHKRCAPPASILFDATKIKGSSEHLIDQQFEFMGDIHMQWKSSRPLSMRVGSSPIASHLWFLPPAPGNPSFVGNLGTF